MAISIPLASAARRLAPPADAADADLLDRFTRSRDPDAFEAIIRRHGPAVRGVCRARLGNPADADDAFQATFLVLARDAERIRESLAGWLYRVALMVSLKMRRYNARRVTDALPPDSPAAAARPEESVEAADLRAAVAEEVAALPDKFRGVLVLCGLEGRSNAEAAAILGCPKGTVDTRLAAAKRKLRDRLARRGIALTAALTIEGLLGRADAGSGFDSLASATVADAIAYSSPGGLGSNPMAALLANGVKPTMSHTIRLFAAGLLAVAALGTAGLGLYQADAQEKGKAKVAEATKPTEPTKPAAAPAEAAEAAPVATDETSVRAILNSRLTGLNAETITLRELLALLEQRGINARLDAAAFQRLSQPLGEGSGFDFHEVSAQIHERKIILPNTRGMSVGDLLTDALAQLPYHVSYRVRGNQVLIGPAFKLPTIPGNGANRSGEEIEKFVDHKLLAEYLAGPPVSISIDSSLPEAINNLRKLTGANIVIDARAKANLGQQVSGTFDDVRLLTVLQVIGDMAELKPVVLNNVYYLTTSENAAKLQREVNRDLFGEPQAGQQVPVPPGFVTDGYQYYPRTADMKAVDPATVMTLGGSNIPGVKPVPPTAPAPQAKPPEKK